MKKLTKVLLSSFVLFSFSSLAAEDLHNKLTIQALWLKGSQCTKKRSTLLCTAKLKNRLN